MLEDDGWGCEVDGWSKVSWGSPGGEADGRFRSATASRTGGSISRWIPTALIAAKWAKCRNQREGLVVMMPLVRLGVGLGPGVLDVGLKLASSSAMENRVWSKGL